MEQMIRSAELEHRPASLQFSNMSNDEQNSDQKLLIIGTYQLSSEMGKQVQDSREREGNVYLVCPGNLQIVDSMDLGAGIFRFGQQNQRLIAALSSGDLALIKYANMELHLETEFSICQNSMLLDCSARDEKIICSNDKGQIFVFDMQANQIITSLDAHCQIGKYAPKECQVWSCTWLDSETFASGAEDASLKIWDLRSSDNAPMQMNQNTHGAGVTFIFNCDVLHGTNKQSSHQLLTGSYDDHLRLFDLRCLKRSVAEQKLNGGIWDVKRIGESACLITACMYGGWNIVKLCPNSALELVHSQPENGQALLYGVDAQIQTGNDGMDLLIASCTFNDRKLHMEKISLDI